MTLLRKQDSTFLDSSLNNDSLAAYIVLDWLRQIVVKASQTFALIYHEIRLFLVAPRSIKGSKQGFAQRRKGVAHILGKIHRTIWTCNVSPARDVNPALMSRSRAEGWLTLSATEYSGPWFQPVRDTGPSLISGKGH